MSNRIFTNKRPNLSDTEIDGFKNFDSVLDKVSQAPPSPGTENTPKFNFKNFLKYSKNIFIAGVGIAAAVLAIKWFSNNGSDMATTPNNSDTTVAEEANPAAIAPPIVGLETPFDIYTINAQKDETITTPTGTEIHIKKNTFLDENGKVMKGKVDVQFREYHNVLDIFKSGIPMDYDSSGTSYTFESAGMFDIQAKQGNKMVASFSEDIVVDIVSDNKSTEFNDYYYDTTKRKWEFLSKSSILKAEPDYYNVEVDETKPRLTEQSDKESIITENAIASSTTAVVLSAPTRQPTAPKAIDYPPILSAKYAFEVDFDKRKFPEIYSRSVFQVDESQSNFSPVYYKVNWEVVQLTALDEKDKYKLHLEKGNQKLDVQCFPAISKDEYNRIKSEYDIANKAYQDSLTIWNRWVVSQRASSINNDHMISDVERSVVAQLSKRRVNVALPGVYNCDNPIYSQRYFGDNVRATFSIGDSANITSLRNYTVEQRTNALFAARNGNSLILDKSKKLIVWIWTSDHQIGIIESNQLKNYKSTQEFDVALYPAEAGLARLDELLEKL
jgi:hypothetical protein